MSSIISDIFMEELVEETGRQLESVITKEKRGYYDWPVGMLLLGLTNAGAEDAVSKYLKAVPETEIDRVDNGLAGYSVLKAYERTGESVFRDKVSETAEYLFKWRKDEMGSFLYSDRSDNFNVYSDGTGMGAIFMAEYAKYFGDEKAKELSRKQTINFLDFGVDEKTGLPYHGYEYKTKAKHPNLGWGRGMGWISLGIGGYIDNFADEEFNRRILILFGHFFEYLKEDYMFSWNLPTLDGNSDTSATGMIMWAACKIMQRVKPDLIERDLLEKIVRASMSTVKEGVVYNSSGACLDFGAYRETTGPNFWGQGAILAFLSEARKLI